MPHMRLFSVMFFDNLTRRGWVKSDCEPYRQLNDIDNAIQTNLKIIDYWSREISSWLWLSILSLNKQDARAAFSYALRGIKKNPLEKELRTEILNIVEMKIDNGEVMDFSTVLPILFPFLTDGDDYLRKKANVLVEKGIGNKTGSKEDEGRQLRRFFFSYIKKRYNAQRIALAQYEDDQIETFFIRLARGTTVSGLDRSFQFALRCGYFSRTP